MRAESEPSLEHLSNQSAHLNVKSVEADAQWRIEPSQFAKRTVNPIRQICDNLSMETNPNKPLIKLNLGDPRLSNILPHCEIAERAIIEALSCRNFEGYGPATGIQLAKEAIAQYFTCDEAPITADSVIMTSGCSHALKMAIEVLANAGDNILVPAPGFSLYSTLMRPLKIEDRLYEYDLSGRGSINFGQLESLIDGRTRAIILNNPSNPTGVVLDKMQLQTLLAIAHANRVPIIADEVYGTMVYNGAQFHPIATLEPRVPILRCDGIAKRYLLPGWRLGWLIVHDRFGSLSAVRAALGALAQKIVGPCVLIQAAVPRILAETPASFFHQVNTVISANARLCFEQLSRVPGLRPIMPNGAMYMMVAIDEQIFGAEQQFVQGLLHQQSVFCLPGQAFYCPGWFRMVLIHSLDVTQEACSRITEYCRTYYTAPHNSATHGTFTSIESVNSNLI